MNLGALFTGGRDRAGTMKNVIPWQMPRKTGGAGDEGPLRRGGIRHSGGNAEGEKLSDGFVARLAAAAGLSISKSTFACSQAPLDCASRSLISWIQRRFFHFISQCTNYQARELP